MARPGEISVELKLQLDKLTAQAKKAASILKTNIGSDMGKASTATKTAADSQDKLERSTKKATSALERQLAEWKRLRKDGIEPGMKIIMAAQGASAGLGGPGAVIAGGNTGAGLATSASALAARRKYPAPMVPNPQFQLASSGGSAASGSSTIRIGQLLASYYLITRAIQVALVPLRKFAQEVGRAADAAARIYARSMTSGFGVGMTVQRGMLASIIGVSENEIFQFGKAIAYLQPQLARAQQIMRDTTVPLTQVNWQFKVLQADMSALWAQIGADAAPALLKLADSLDILVKVVTDNLSKLEKIGNIAKWFNPLYLWHRATENMANRWNGVSQSQVDRQRSHGVMPGPMAYMKQMPASNWERMGLVIGGGGGVNYSQQTAVNTKRTANGIERLLHQTQNMNNITRTNAIPASP